MATAVGAATRTLASVQQSQHSQHSQQSPPLPLAVSRAVCAQPYRIGHGLVCGYSSSTFFASETPFSFMTRPMPRHHQRQNGSLADVDYYAALGVEKTADKSEINSRTVQASQSYPQNEDLPPSNIPKTKKKPYVRPVKHGSYAKRMRRRELKSLPPKPQKAPANGMLVKRLIPVAHLVYKAHLVVLDGVSRLLKHLPVKACRWCSEVHVGREGHEIRTCQGKHSTTRRGEHLWLSGQLADIVVPLEAFHLVDRLAKPIRHDDRFKHDRIPGLVELCIQAGADLPEYPTLRRTSPIDKPGSGQQVDCGEKQATFSGNDGMSRRTEGSIDNHRIRPTDETGGSVGTDDTNGLEGSSQSQLVSEEVDAHTIKDDDDLKTVAEKTLHAWAEMRAGAAQLMEVYPVRACGYCPEVHIGRRGHKLQLCGAFKHQWRNGQHGWQDAALDDLIPPSFVWHVRDVNGPPLKNSLSKYYGKVPAVVELCVQAGADIPTKYKPLMRLDVIIPDLDELEMVA